MAYTIEDFNRDYLPEIVSQLPAQEQEAILSKLPAKRLLDALSTEEIEEYLKRRRKTVPLRKRKKPG